MSRPPRPMPRSYFVKGYLTVAGWIAATAATTFAAAFWHLELTLLALICVAAATFCARELSLCSLERPSHEEVPRNDRPATRQFVGRTGLSSRRIW